MALAARLARRGWLRGALALGLLAVAVIAIGSALAGSADRDTLQRGMAELLVIGGIVVAVGLGSTALNRDSDSGHHGLLVAAGLHRPRLVAEVLLARTGLLVGVLAAWGLAGQLASLALGLGPDGPLALHTLAMMETQALVLLAAAAASSVVGPGASAVVGVAVFTFAQAIVNLKAAADEDLLGTAGRAVGATYALLPRTVTSPMIADLQARDQAGIAAPQIDINGNVATLAASGAGTVAWVILWCGLLGVMAVGGMRRRTL